MTVGMTLGVCRTCDELIEGARACPRCGSKLARTRRDILAWEWERQKTRIAGWVTDGVIDAETGRKLVGCIADLDEHAKPETHANAETHVKDGESAVERGADVAVTAAGEMFHEMATRWKRLAKSIDEDSPPREDGAAHGARQHDDRTVEAGRAIFAREGQAAVVGAGIEALAGLDEDEGTSEALKAEQKPFGALQVFWFIGTILVLAGSVMGVREAWRTLEGVWRPVVIAGAFFVYHVLFVGLSRLLVRRSVVTGRVLAGISAGLLPVVFVAAAVAIGQQASIGVPFAGALFLGSIMTLVLVGRISDRTSTGVALAMGLAPSLLIELAIGSGGASDARRGVFVLVALAPLAIAATRARVAATSTSIVGLAAAAYGAVAVSILGLYGGPGDPSLPFDGGGIAQRALVTWLAVTATVAWWASSGPAIVARLTRLAAVPLVLSLAVLVSTSAAALVMGLAQDPAAPRAATLGLAWHAPLAVMVLATAVLAIEQRARPSVLHVAVLVSLGMMTLVGKTFAPERAELWPAACAVVPASFLLLGALAGDRRRRAILATWGIVAGLATLLTVLGVEALTRTPADAMRPWILTSITGAGLALSAHAGGRTTRPSLHVVGAMFALVAVTAWLVPSTPALLSTSDDSWPHTLMLACAGLAASYGVLALGYASFASKDDDRRPLDDVSLVLASGAVWFGVLLAPRAAPPDELMAPSTRMWLALPSAALAVVLFVRSLRDRSALVVAQGAVAVVLAVAVYFGQRSGNTLFYGVLACALAVPAALREPRAETAPRFGRAIYGIVPLPLSGGPRRLLDGFAIVSLVLAAFALLPAIAWLGVAQAARFETERMVVLCGLAGVLCTAILAFATRAFELFRARGSVVTLWIAAPAIALTAVAYRIGRPLAPDVVGFRLSIVIALVWLLARGLVKIGPRLARGLDRPAHGAHYHHVAHFGVLALALLLFADAILVGGPTPTRSLAVTPPLLLAGSALGAFLLYRSYGREPLLHVGLLLCASATFVAFAQRHVLGPELVPLDPPGGRWVPAATAAAARLDWLDPARFLAPGDTELASWNRAWLGLGAATAALAAVLVALLRAPAFARAVRSTIFAREESEAPEIERAVAVSIAILSVLLAFGLAWQPSVPAALAFAVAGGLTLVVLSPSYRVLTPLLAAPLLVHALAQSGTVVPVWPGPAIALLGLGAVLAGRRVSGTRGRDPALLLQTQVVALAYAPMAVAYALAAGGGTSADAALPRVLDQASSSLAGQWIVSFAPSLTFPILAGTLCAAGLAWRGGLAKLLLVGPPLVLAIGAGWLAAAFTNVSGELAIAVLVTREGPLLAAGLAVAATISHVAAFQAASRRRDDATVGLSVGRDVVLVASALVMCVFVATRTPGGFAEGPCGIAALGLAVVVSVHTIAWQGTGRHVAFVETLLVAFYAFATRSLRLRPEVDAMIGLLYGFSLLGVAVIARRRKVDAVADATRRFAAALPLAVALLTMSGATNEAAGFALGASVLYGAMAWVERSRIFGSLAALAANLGLVVFAVAQGLDGAEVYVGPLGIFVTALAQIFAPKMTPAARSMLRILGGALLYLPAGLKLTFRLGAAEDGTYSVIFGVVCLLGVVAGLVLRVRAYLALGTLFLTLDVIANLVHAGLRDHRVGFVLLSVSGLAILGIMIGITLRRDRAWAVVGRLRMRLRAWD